MQGQRQQFAVQLLGCGQRRLAPAIQKTGRDKGAISMIPLTQGALSGSESLSPVSFIFGKQKKPPHESRGRIS